MTPVAVALADAVALLQEFKGAPLDEKLRAFGLDARDVADVLRERLESYGVTERAERQAFAHAFCEGLLAGITMRRNG